MQRERFGLDVCHGEGNGNPLGCVWIKDLVKEKEMEMETVGLSNFSFSISISTSLTDPERLDHLTFPFPFLLPSPIPRSKDSLKASHMIWSKA